MVFSEPHFMKNRLLEITDFWTRLLLRSTMLSHHRARAMQGAREYLQDNPGQV
jgi:hypothetical protein